MTMRFHNSIRTLAFATSLLQLLTLPATCVLHVGCAHGEACVAHVSADEPGSPDTASHCDCGHDHAPRELAQVPLDSDSPDSRQHQQHSHHHDHHDHHGHHHSQSCRICQSAFALVTATVLPVRLPAIECVAVVEILTPVTPQTPAGVRWYGRGPPTA